MPIVSSEKISRILEERDWLFKPAKELALWHCQGHFGKVHMFFEALERRGGIVMPGTTIVYCRACKGSNEHHLAFFGSEDEVFERLDAIKDPRKPVPASVAVKMLASRIIKVIEGIKLFNKNEDKRAENQRLLLLQPNPPAWASPYIPEHLPDLTLEDLPDCTRYLVSLSAGVLRGPWSFRGDGKTILELQKLWKRPDMTPEAIEQAWKIAAVHQVMSS